MKPVKKIVLLIEDNPGDARLVREAMNASPSNGGYRIVEADSLHKGIEKLSRLEVDAILLDLSLPDCSGIETFHQLRENAPQIPIIILTGTADLHLARTAVSDGAQDFLVKDAVRGDLLVRSIEYAIDRNHLAETSRIAGEQYRVLAETMVDTVWILDVDDRRFTYVSPSVQRLLGYTPEEIELGSIDTLFPEQDLARGFDWLEQTTPNYLRGKFSPEQSFRYEAVVVGKDGTRVWTEVISRFYSNPGNGHTEIHGVSRDISERRRMQQAFQLMSDTQHKLARLDSLPEICQAVGTTIQQLIGEGYVCICMGDADNLSTQIAGLYGTGPQYAALVERLHFDPFKLKIDRLSIPDDRFAVMASDSLVRFSGNLYDLASKQVPRKVCTVFERELGIKEIHVMGFIWNGLHFGELIVFPKRDVSQFKSMIETIMSQAAITINRIKAEISMRETDDRLNSVFENTTIGIYRALPDGTFILANPTFVRMLGYAAFEEMQGADLKKDGFEAEFASEHFLQIMAREGEIAGLETYWKRRDGTTIFVRESARAVRDLDGRIQYFEGTAEDISERKLALSALSQSEERYRSLFENSPISMWEEDLSGVKQILDGLKTEGVTDFPQYFLDHPDAAAECVSRIKVVDINQATVKLLRARSKDHVLATLKTYFLRDSYQDFAIEFTNIAAGKRDFDWDGSSSDLFGQKLILRLHLKAVPGYEDSLSKVLITMFDMTVSRQAEEVLKHQSDELQQRNEELARLYRASGALIEVDTYDMHALAKKIVEVVLGEFGHANCSVFLVQSDTNVLDRIAVGGAYAAQVSKTQLTLDGPGQVPLAIRTGEIINTPDVRQVPAYVPSWEQARSELTIPLKIGERAIGAIDVQSTATDVFSVNDERLISIFAERAAMASEHARLYAQTERRLQNLTSLRTIDMAIASSSDLRFTLGILLDQVGKQLGIHAADVLVFNPVTQMLRYMNGIGFHTRALQYTNLRLNDGYAGRAARERRIITIQNLDKHPGGLERSSDLAREGFISYVGVPLIAKGQVKGVLEIFQREALELDQEKVTFLEMLAGQAAIAIDNYELFENLQSSNAELLMAYDETIEGWSHAMDLRDQETEGHSQRVSEMTLRLAATMGFGTEELVHIRRGALLHDIGKIGVPDEVLRKPGSLTDEEWVIMRKHPVFAYEMISPILYLRKALDIPYCHHEKWDGSGYPRGLKGEQIPLSARIFAVVDVWDALTSDRPYRKAWSEQQTIEYLVTQKDRHFDPHVVDVFLRELSNRSS